MAAKEHTYPAELRSSVTGTRNAPALALRIINIHNMPRGLARLNPLPFLRLPFASSLFMQLLSFFSLAKTCALRCGFMYMS